MSNAWMRMTKGTVLSLILQAANVANAQTNAAALLGKMENVSVYPIFELRTSDRTYAETGHGIEFTFLIGEWTRGMNDDERESRCRKINRDLKKAGKPESCNAASTEDTSSVLSELRGKGRTDSVFTVSTSKLLVTRIQFELAVASHTTRLLFRDAPNNWELTGRVVEFPVLTLYGTFRPDWRVSPYVGARFTLAELKNARITQGDSVATVDADDVGVGAALGAVWEPAPGFNVFGEVSYADLRFSTPQWKTPANLRPLAPTFPQRLDLIGLRFTTGVQIQLGTK